MKTMIDNYATSCGGWQNIIDDYENGRFFNSAKVNDLQTRFNFDMMYNAKLTDYVCETIYTYAHDKHIETALKSICPKVIRRY